MFFVRVSFFFFFFFYHDQWTCDCSVMRILVHFRLKTIYPFNDSICFCSWKQLNICHRFNLMNLLKFNRIRWQKICIYFSIIDHRHISLQRSIVVSFSMQFVFSLFSTIVNCFASCICCKNNQYLMIDTYAKSINTYVYLFQQY